MLECNLQTPGIQSPKATSAERGLCQPRYSETPMSVTPWKAGTEGEFWTLYAKSTVRGKPKSMPITFCSTNTRRRNILPQS